MKRIETKRLEKALLLSCFGANPRLAKEYGTTEVTIDFQRNGNGRELVDFISYDAKKDLFRCYEIKVTMADFKSNAKNHGTGITITLSYQKPSIWNSLWRTGK